MSYNNEPDRLHAIESLTRSIQNLSSNDSNPNEKKLLMEVIKNEADLIKTAQNRIEPNS